MDTHIWNDEIWNKNDFNQKTQTENIFQLYFVSRWFHVDLSAIVGRDETNCLLDFQAVELELESILETDAEPEVRRSSATDQGLALSDALQTVAVVIINSFWFFELGNKGE